MLGILDLGHIWEPTFIRIGHGDDSYLAQPPLYVGTHYHGWAEDGWFLATKTPGDWLAPDDPRFLKALADATTIKPWYYQTGLAGSSWTKLMVKAAGEKAFHDEGADHIHFGAQPLP